MCESKRKLICSIKVDRFVRKEDRMKWNLHWIWFIVEFALKHDWFLRKEAIGFDLREYTFKSINFKKKMHETKSTHWIWSTLELTDFQENKIYETKLSNWSRLISKRKKGI